MSTALDRVLCRLESVRRIRRGWTARCPAHADRRPSLTVALGADDRVLIHCWAGCRPEDIVAGLGLTLADLFVRRSVSAERTTPKHPRASARAFAIRHPHRQPWNLEQVHELYVIADAVRRRHQLVDRARRFATAASDCDESWEVLVAAVRVEVETFAAEALLDEATA